MAAAAFPVLDCGGRGLLRRGEDLFSVGFGDRTAALSESVGRVGWNPLVMRQKKRVRAAMAIPVADRQNCSNTSPLVKRKESSSRNLPPVSPEKLDEWTRQSVIEIVRNIGEAPFLVHVFLNNGSDEELTLSTSSSSSVRLETEPAMPLSWPWIRKRWEEDDRSLPDGIILVEELKEEEQCSDEMQTWDKSTKTWGLLVQGRGLDCTVCYILNTCRVLSSIGACTHFCLIRAECFGDTADVQLRKSWLVQQ